MESNIVIKVKYGDTLRRFNARVDENEQLELDMGALRGKILSLFNLARDADLTLTYIDVDGDVVTLVDDDDLHDVMRQCLNPFRINVLLNNDKGGRSYTISSGSSTPMRSPRVQLSLPNINTGVAGILKSAPEPFREVLSKLSLDLATKAASSAPLLAELVDSVSKMGQSYLSPGSQFQAGAESSTQSEASGSPVDPLVANDPKSSKDGGMSDAVPNTTFVDLSSQSSLKVDIGNVTRGVATPVTPAPASVDLILDLPADSVPSGCATVNAVPDTSNVPAGDNRKETEKGSDGHRSGISVGFGPSKRSADPMKHYHWGPPQVKELEDALKKRLSSNPQVKELEDALRKRLSGNFRNSSPSQFGLNPFSECPFAGMPLPDVQPVTPVQYPRIHHQFKRSYSHSDGMGGVFHKGVCCDGCGVHPITGPRFKSKVKEDYDLCSICFAEMGNEADYIRLDHPVSHRHHLSLKGVPDPHSRVRPPALPHLLRGCGMKPGRPKLDSRFILDVNVLDGTMMAPSTPFTKIWRMCNNGSFVWLRGTQLVWIGGDKFCDAVSVEIEIPADGVQMDKELDIAVDFKAPVQPGRYISYWRMASPSGQKFGQRVWVLIQVDVSLKDSLCGNFHGLNLNLPPDSSGSKGPEIIDVNVKPAMDESVPEFGNYRVTYPVVDAPPNKDQELNFPINDTLLVGNGVSNPVPPVVPSSVSYQPGIGVSNPVPPVVPSSISYPIIDFSEVAPDAPSASSARAVAVPTSSEEISGNSDVEKTLLKELEEMGFRQVDLNKEILRMNEYNLEQSVDDLCGVAEWDPILEELQEMGFTNNEMNKRLLKKNNGSIKRVVMDLIAGEKA